MICDRNVLSACELCAGDNVVLYVCNNSTNRGLLLSLKKDGIKRDFTISRDALTEISETFPEHMRYDETRRKLEISREIYPHVIGTHLKPMDTCCLELEI
jgi:hypothetical protein